MFKLSGFPGGRRILQIGLLALGTACSDSALDVASGSGDSGYASESGVEDTGDGGGSAGGGRYWTLRVQGAVSGGELDPASVVLTAQVVREDGTEVCVSTAPVEAMEAVSGVLPDPLLLAWWEITPGEWSGTCQNEAQRPLQETFFWGLGAPYEEVVAAAAGNPEVSELALPHLNTAYARFPWSEVIYAYGVVGDAAAFAGEAELLTQLPLRDGTWSTVPIYSFVL
jgi:hypothetical protein